MILLAAPLDQTIKRFAGLTSFIEIVVVEGDSVVDLFWNSRWEVAGTRLEWFCSWRLWIKRFAGLTSFIELVFVERDGAMDLFLRSRWEDTGTRLGWICLWRLWIKRVVRLVRWAVECD